jgi:hypothetical protein
MTASKDTPQSGENVSDEQTDTNIGASMTTLGAEMGWAHVHAPDSDGRTPITVKGEWCDDEPGHVILTAPAGNYELSLSLTPSDARALAAKITSAASYAEGDR